MKKIFGLAVAAAFVVAAQAAHTVQLVPVNNNGFQVGGNDVFTYDVQISVTGNAPTGAPDDWLVATVFAGSTGFLSSNLLAGKTIYQDSFGGNTTPNPAFLPVFPSLAWDTFITGPASYPNTGVAAALTVATGGDFTTTETTWSDTVNTGNGSFTLARLSIVNGGNRAPLTLTPTGIVAGSFTIRTQTNANAGNPQVTVLSIYQVPEPSTLSLLALGGLAGLIRRR